MTETINGLHSCKPGNDPVVGQIKSFVVQHMTSKKGKPYLKIKSANAENGGSPHRIISAEKTDFMDQHGNISFNLEIEATGAEPDWTDTPHGEESSAFQQTKAAMRAEDWPDEDDPHHVASSALKAVAASIQAPPARSNGGDGVTEARKHLMKAANLYNLCIAAVDKAIAGNLPEVARTSEQFQATLASLWIEASSRRSNDNKTWWSYIDLMPDTPLHKAKPQPEEEPPF